jgi:hypothetical protein
MVVDKFTKFILSVIAFSLCLNALNPWVSPSLVEAAGSDVVMDRSVKKIANELEKIALGIEAIVVSKYSHSLRDVVTMDQERENVLPKCTSPGK